MLPLLAVGYGLSAIYSAGKALDNYRYWNDYYRNTGHRPRYPWHAGAYDWVSYAGGSLKSGISTYYLAKWW